MIKHVLSFVFLLFIHNVQAVQTELDEWIATAKKSITKKVLDNGMTVLFYPLPHTSVVDIRATVNTGSRHECTGQFGLAHMVEHMIFKGTASMSEVDLKLIAEKFGGTAWNAVTSMDQTSYFFQTDNKNWPIFLSIMADCMNNVRFDENHFASEVKTVISELNMNRANPARKMSEAVILNSFGLTHPYHHSPIGTREDLINASAQDLKDFYHAHYTPDKTVLTIVGNVDPEILFKKIDEYFGVIPASQNASTRTEYDADAFLPTDFIQVHSTIHTQTKNPCTFLYWVVPGQRSADSTVADALCYILNERLKKIKDTLDLVYSCNAFMVAFFDAGVFGCSFEPKTDAPEQIRILIENEINDLMHAGPTDAEIAQFKLLEQNAFINGFENINVVADILKCYCLHNNEYEVFDRFGQVQNITADDIKNFCVTYLNHNISNSISCIPLTEEEKIEWTGMQEKIDVYEKKLLSKKNRESVLEEAMLIGKLPEPELLDINFPCPDRIATLSNGLKVYIKQRTHAPALVLLCSFKNPSYLSIYHQQCNKSNIPTLAMSLLREASEGTECHPKEFSKKEHTQFFDSLGVAWSLSIAGATLQCLPSDFEPAATRLLHILTKPTYPEEPFSRVVHNTIQRIIMNKEDTSYRAQTHLNNYLYQDYPWTKNDEELIQDLKGHSPQDLHDFHQQFVTPDTMYLTLVGNIDPDEAIQRLENIFGTWKSNRTTDDTIIKSIDIPDITNPATQDITITLPKEQVTLVAGRLTTAKGTDEGRALLLIEGYLNRILFNIRERMGLFYFCHANLAPSSWITKNDARIITVIPPCNVERTKYEIKSVLQYLSMHGIPAEYLKIAKQNYRASVAKCFATNGELIGAYNNVITNDKTFSYFNDQADNIDKLTHEFVNEVARTYCAPETWTFIQAGRVENLDNNATT